MKRTEFIELTTKILSNEASAEEKARLEFLLKEEEYRNLYNWITGKLEENNQESEEFGFDLNRGLFKLTQKIRKQEPEFEWLKNRAPLFNHHPGFFKVAAASIIFFVLLSASIFETCS